MARTCSTVRSNGTFQIGANAGQSLSVKIGNMSDVALGTDAGKVSFGTTATITAGDVADGTYSVQANGDNNYKLVDSNNNTVATSADGKKFTLASNAAKSVDFTSAVTSGAVTVAGTSVKATATASEAGTKLGAGDYTVASTANGAGTFDVLDATGKTVGTASAATGGAVKVGSDSTASFTLEAGSNKFSVGGADVSTQVSANTTITALDKAISAVSGQRADLGAVQNRLQHTINSLSVAAENASAAESRIRDTDMAKEMTSFTRSQILQQAGVSMLAQANQAPQSVLKLLG